MAACPVAATARCLVKNVDGRPHMYLPRAEKVIAGFSVELLEIGGIKLAIEVLPSRGALQLERKTSVKVLQGKIRWTEGSQEKERCVLPSPASVAPITIPSTHQITAGDRGALLFTVTMPSDTLPRFEQLSEMRLRNLCSDANDARYEWVKFSDICPDAHFAGLEFFNAKGFTLHFNDGPEFCTIQFWAAGKGVDCGLHNHATDNFCELHACLINGTGSGGMTYAQTFDREAKQISLVVPSLYEHGPLWQLDAASKVVYPWHRWQAGTDSQPGQSFDLWVAFEFNPRLVYNL